MAMKKVGKVGRVPDVGHQPPPPMAAIGPLTVTAQGAILKGDERLMFAVRVLDGAGKPVTGLQDQHFKVWQLGHFFGEIGDTFVVELGEIDGLEGLYHLVRSQWSLVPNGTIPFAIRVARNNASTGTALTFVVKVREGLDT
jgi:hypothetical protein